MNSKFKKIIVGAFAVGMILGNKPVNAVSLDKSMMLGMSGVDKWDKNSTALDMTGVEKVIMGEKYETPIAWIRLDKPNSNLMLSEVPIDMTFYNMERFGHYSDSNNYLREYMITYSQNDFNIEESEEALIKSTRLEAESMHYNATDLETEEFFALSKNEFEDYVGGGTALAKSIRTLEGRLSLGFWLRSNSSGDMAYYVDRYGDLLTQVLDDPSGVRPAFDLDETKVLFTSPATDIKDVSASQNLQVVTTDEPVEWKMTVKDRWHTLSTVATTKFNPGDSTSIDYTGASEGHTLSAMIMNRYTNEITHYGKVLESTSESGSVSFNLPAEFNNEDYKLVMFTETLNGDNKSDLASNMVEVVKKDNTETNIISFIIAGQEGATVIDNVNHKIEVTMPYGTDLTALAPSITLSSGATVYPQAGTIVNFTNEFDYLVTAEDGTTTLYWTVEVKEGEQSAVDVGKIKAENATYTDPTNPEDCKDEEAIEAYIENIAKTAVNNNELTITVNKRGYTAPIAGTKANPNGVNGEYKFTITISKGLESKTTTEKTVIVKAEVYKKMPVLSGDNQTVIEGKNADIIFRVDGDFTKFENLYYNGKVVDKANYEAKSGSVVITLKSNYVKTLSAGKHTFTVAMTNGEAVANLNITKKIVEEEEEEMKNPQTSDNIVTYIILVISSILTSLILIFKGKILEEK